jgi:oligoendopeptidase F
VDQLASYDIDAPLVRTRRHIPYEEARTLILEAMTPLGAEYGAVLRRGLYEERWVDWAVNEGKTGGAEQSGAYGLHPFVLISYGESLLGVSALAHEMGHAMHTHFTNQSQPPVYENYADYLGETASTFSQALLRARLLNSRDDPDLQLEALADALTYFHRYLFVMPLLAQFELELHERIERGGAISADDMSTRMLELLGEGYGAGVTLDVERDGVMWAQFSHPYLNFYTYTYGLGLSAATALADGVLRGESQAAARYLAFLKAGDSVYPLDAWRLAGIDMSAPEPVERAFDVLEEMVDRLDALVGTGPLRLQVSIASHTDIASVVVAPKRRAIGALFRVRTRGRSSGKSWKVADGVARDPYVVDASAGGTSTVGTVRPSPWRWTIFHSPFSRR